MKCVNRNSRYQQGIALLIMMALLFSSLAVLSAYYAVTQADHFSTRAFREVTSAFYASEAGLNWRLKTIRDILENRSLSGTSSESVLECKGDGDFACEKYMVGNYMTHVSVKPQGPPSLIVVPAGEPYEGRSAQQYNYMLVAEARHKNSTLELSPEARLSMTVRVRQVPLFQFAAFFDKDLEIYPGPPMVVSGAVHTNGDLYLSGNTTLRFNEALSTAGQAYRGLKALPGVDFGGSIVVRVPDGMDSESSVGFLNGSPGMTELTASEAQRLFKGRFRVQLPRALLPPLREFAPEAGAEYWDKSDLRIILNLSPSIPRAEVWSSSGIDNPRTLLLNSCLSFTPRQTTVAEYNNVFIDRREGGLALEILDIDLEGLLTCAHNERLFEDSRRISDATDDGIVAYFTVLGSRSNDIQSRYAVRIRNGASIALINGEKLRGITIVTDQPLFTQGNINTVDPVPFALMSDTINVLSESAVDSCPGIPNQAVCGKAQTTSVIAAIISGSDTTGGEEGAGGRKSPESGGLQNFIRFHEDWSGVAFNYTGALVSLKKPQHANGVFTSPLNGNVYTAPNRNWNYNTSFNDPNKLPPLTPKFTYVQQEMFSRELE